MISVLFFSALIVATTAQRLQQGDVRLINGTAPYRGTLQVWNAGEWRYVCDDGFGIEESIVVCRQLGYWPPTPQNPICCQRVSDPPRYWLDNVQCRGTETRISECRHNGWGIHNCGSVEGVLVICQYRDPCSSNPCPSGATCARIDNVRYECNTGPPPDTSPPGYRISLEGFFQTQDRSIISAECTSAYSREMEIKAFQQLDIINQRLGSVLCRGTTGFEFLVVGSSVNTAQNRGIVMMDFIMMGQGTNRYREYFTCSEEASTFLQSFSNWEQPLLPTPPGCPPVEFLSTSFRETGKDWFC